jgi:hypothetical protein
MHLRRHGNLERTIMATPIPASSILDALQVRDVRDDGERINGIQLLSRN